MNDAELLSHTRSLLWRAWASDDEEIGSVAAATLLGLGMLVPEGGAAELARLRERVAELEAAARPAILALPPSRVTRRALAQMVTEDPHDSPLHHAYRVGRDLPAGGGSR